MTELTQREMGFYVGFLENTFEPLKPLAKLITTAGGAHIYDTGTNKILRCGKEVAGLIQGLLSKGVHRAKDEFISRYGEKKFLEAAAEIADAVTEGNIFRVQKTTGFGLSAHFNNYEHILRTSVQSISLEITQDCNLRCSYCIFNDHVKERENFSKTIMSIDVAKKAIGFLHRHSTKTDTPYIGFYGGEPLMRFPFIKECTEYAKNIFTDRRISFNITTNAILVTPEIAEYLLKNGFSILVSLDGPENYHDDYRKDRFGNGSFKKTLASLKILANQREKIKKGHISINMVYTPPYSEEKLIAIENFLANIEWLSGVSVRIGYPSDGSIPPNRMPGEDFKEDKGIIQWAFEKYRGDLRKSSEMVSGLAEKRFAKLMKRPVLTGPLDRYTLNGCCIPGQKKNFISPDGTISICEKLSIHSPPIGNVNDGFDFEKIKKVYIDGYSEKSVDDCSECWGVRLCDLCYIGAFNEDGDFDLKRKRKHCHAMLKTLEGSLRHFVALMEENPGGLDYLYQYEFK